MAEYRHTQIGYLMIGVLCAIVLLYAFILVQAQVNTSVLLVMIFVVLLLFSFSWLTVEVDAQSVNITFGYGIFRKKFPLDQIASVEKVRNHWYYGWGIRWWPRMWIYNISGFDAVQLTLHNGKIYRIGTDDQDGLYEAMGRIKS